MLFYKAKPEKLAEMDTSPFHSAVTFLGKKKYGNSTHLTITSFACLNLLNKLILPIGSFRMHCT